MVRNFEASVFVYWDLLAILLVQMEQWWSYDVPVDGRRAELISRQKKRTSRDFHSPIGVSPLGMRNVPYRSNASEKPPAMKRKSALLSKLDGIP